MKKIPTMVMIGLLCLSMFSMFAPQAKAESAYLTDLVQLTTNPYRDRAPFWSPDSSKIVYVAFEDTWYRHLWVMNADGSGKTQLTSGGIDDDGDYSPDGTKIVFMRYGLRGIDGSDLMMMNADGTNIQQLTSTGLHRGQPKWSHNGQELAFYYGGAGTNINEIHTMNVDGTNEITLVSSSYPYMNVYWSPGDTKIVYSMNDGIWLVSTSPPYEKTHLFTTSIPTHWPIFSPDGKFILFAQGEIGTYPDLYLIDASGNFIAQLTSDSMIDYPFDWSPDGQYIAFGSIKSGNTDIWRAKIAGTFSARAMVGHWKLDEGSGNIAYDSVGTNNGIIRGVPDWTTGIVGGALRFDGAQNNYVALSSQLDVTDAMTVEVWVYPEFDPTNPAAYPEEFSCAGRQIIRKSSCGDDTFFLAFYSGYYFNPANPVPYISAAFFYQGGGGAGLEPVSVPGLISEGQWYHLVATYKRNDYARLYVNGVEKMAVPTEDKPLRVSSRHLTIGQEADVVGGDPLDTPSTPQTWIGKIDEAKIYNYARTAAEIQEDYLLGEGRKILIMDIPWGSLDRGTGQSGWDYTWTFPNGSEFTVRGFLQSKGYVVDVSGEILGANPLTLSVLSNYDVVILPTQYFDIPENVAYQNVFVDYVSQGGGLLFLGQAGVGWVTLDESLGFHMTETPHWNFYVDAQIVDYTHPITNGLTELPKSGGVFVDWDSLIDDSPLPAGTSVLARTTGTGGMYDPSNKIALIAFTFGQGRVVAGPVDGMMRPYGPTAVDGYNVISEPVIENKLLIRSIEWVAPAKPDLEISVSPDQQIAQPDSTVYYQVTITSKNGFSSAVSLDASISPLTTHIGWEFDPSPVTPPANGQATSAFKVNVYSDTPLKTYTITITATGGGISADPRSVKLNVERSLEVPYQNQGDTDWCSITSLAMVLHYFEGSFHNWDYAKDKQLATDQGQSLGELYYYLLEYHPTLYPIWQFATTGGKQWIMDSIRSNVSSSFPVIVATSDHGVVVVGYNDTGLFVNDPSGRLFELPPVSWAGDPKSYNHAYVDWYDLEPLLANEILAVHGNVHAPLPSGTVWIENDGETDIEFVQADSRLRLSMNGGLHWIDQNGMDSNVVMEGSVLDTGLYISNSKETSQSLQVRAYIKSEGQVVKELDPRFSPELPGFMYNDWPYLPPEKLITWNSVTVDDVLQSKTKYYIDFTVFDSGGAIVDWFSTPYFYYKEATTLKLKERQRHLYLHVYDTYGNHVGLDYATGQPELEIPGSYYYDDGEGTIVIVVPEIIDLRIVVDATYAEDPVEFYDLTIILNTDLDMFEQTYSGNVNAGEIQTFTTQASETGLKLYAWQYIFKDTSRGTELRINTDEKYFQFIAPDKDLGVKLDPKMKLLNRAIIIICFKDTKLTLLTVAVDTKLDFCVANARDLQTRKCYLLIDKPGIEK